MTKTDYLSIKNDLHLYCRLQQQPHWFSKPSLNVGYHLPVRTYRSDYCEIHLQGYCINHLGRHLTIEDVTRIINQDGIKAINQFDGSFIIAVNERSDCAWCATDPCGSLPLYYRITSEEVTITISPKNFQFLSTDKLDLRGILSFLNSGYPWGELTLLQEWKVLGPGRLIQINGDKQVVCKDYFVPETAYELSAFHSPDDILEELDRSLTSIATRYKNILVPLSGGVDSRLIAIRCHHLGIPFEAITFVANNPSGDDFDIASQLARIMGIKHHRWEWIIKDNCIENFQRLILASGGMNDAFTSYPDGMDFFGQISSGFDCVIRGDETFGWGPTSHSIFDSTALLNIHMNDQLTWAVRPNVTFPENIESLLRNWADCNSTVTGPNADTWKNRFYRKVRIPRFIMPIARWQAQHVVITYPYLTRSFITRMTQTELKKRDDKRIIREALVKCSPASIRAIPQSTSPTWRFVEPLLNLSDEVIGEMIDILLAPSQIDEIIDAIIVAHQFKSIQKSLSDNSIKNLEKLERIKILLKRIIPRSTLKMFKRLLISQSRVSEYLVFKRLFAMKSYLASRSKNMLD